MQALDGVTVEFERGRFTAVMGPSGSGKSTLMHCMAGLDAPTSGRAFIGDEDIGLLDDARPVEKHVKNIFGTLRLPQSPDDHRRVLAVVTYLNSQ